MKNSFNSFKSDIPEYDALNDEHLVYFLSNKKNIEFLKKHLL